MIRSFQGHSPEISQAVFIAESADIIGDVRLAKDVTVWFQAALRGDLGAPITVGEGSNIQDGAVIHMNSGTPVTIGPSVSIAHGAIIHGCTIESGSLVGMGAVVLDDAVIPPGSMVAAGSLVPPGKTYPPGSLILGSPARSVRRLTEKETQQVLDTARRYVEQGRMYASGT